MSSHAALRAERRALAWLAGVFGLGLVLALAQLLVGLEVLYESEVGRELMGLTWTLWSLAELGGLASFISARRGPWATAALGFMLGEWALELAVNSQLLSELLQGPDAYQILDYLTIGLRTAALLAFTGALTIRRGVRPAAADLAVAALVAAVVVGNLVAALEGSRALPDWLMPLLLSATLIGAIAWRLVGIARELPNSDRQPSDPERWQTALRGTRLVRQAEVVRVVVLVAALALGFLAAGARSQGLLVALVIGGGLASLVVMGMEVFGLSLYRQIPPESEGSGPAAAAFVMAGCGALAAVAAVAGLVKVFTGADREWLEHGLNQIEHVALLTGATTLGCLLWSLRRVARRAAAPEVASMAMATLALYLGAALLSMAPSSMVLRRALGRDAQLPLKIGALVFAVAAVLRLIATLNRFEETLDAKAVSAAYEEPFA